MADEVRLSIVMPVLNVRTTLESAVRAVLAQVDAPPFEVLVVDNGSTDGSDELVARIASEDQRVRLIREPSQGLNRARNRGVREAVGQLILLCDGDDLVETDWVAAMARGLRTDDLVGGRLELSVVNHPATLCRWGISGTRIDPTGKMYDFLPAPYGANCGFSKAAWTAVDGFDETLQGGGDDFELFWRAQLNGATYRFVPDAVVHYRLRPGWKAIALRQYRFGKANVHVFRRFRRHGLRRDSVLVALKSWVWIAVMAPSYLMGDERRGRWLRTAAKRAGRLVGSVRNRVLYL